MQTSESIADLATALAKAQGQFGNVQKNREVTVKTKTGGTYKFKYATLDAIGDAIRKPLADNGLSYIQAVAKTDSGMAIDTRLMHASGQWLQTVTPMKIENEGNQAIGSAITYGRRYALSALLGIVSDDDDDSNASDGNTIEESHYRGNGKSAPEAPAERKLTKQQARPEYDKLVKELQTMQSPADLAQWGKRNKPRLDAMPEDWQQSLRDEYASHQAQLNKRAAA